MEHTLVAVLAGRKSWIIFFAPMRPQRPSTTISTIYNIFFKNSRGQAHMLWTQKIPHCCGNVYAKVRKMILFFKELLSNIHTAVAWFRKSDIKKTILQRTRSIFAGQRWLIGRLWCYIEVASAKGTKKGNLEYCMEPSLFDKQADHRDCQSYFSDEYQTPLKKPREQVDTFRTQQLPYTCKDG